MNKTKLPKKALVLNTILDENKEEYYVAEQEKNVGKILNILEYDASEDQYSCEDFDGEDYWWYKSEDLVLMDKNGVGFNGDFEEDADTWYFDNAYGTDDSEDDEYDYFEEEYGD